jgi:adenine C2-methylase RlmN of 23S rRNA A2503 and tRNA A37
MLCCCGAISWPLDVRSRASATRPARVQVRAFRAALFDRGVPCTVRQDKGAEISGACGQLAVATGRGAHPAKGVADIEEAFARLAGKAAAS